MQTHLPIYPASDVNAYAAEGAQDDPAAISDAARQAGRQAQSTTQISEFTGQVAAAADLGSTNKGGLAQVPEPDAEHQVADVEYEEDPDVEMDEDDFVHEGLGGGGGVEEADPDD